MTGKEYREHRQVIVDLLSRVDHANKNYTDDVVLQAATAANNASQALQNLIDMDMQKMGE